MNTQRALIETFKRDLPDILKGDDHISDGDYCERCGMHFKTRENSGGILGDKTVCAEPGCGRWFMHGTIVSNGRMFVTVYKL